MGGSVFDLELEVGCLDDFDLTGLGFTGASLELDFWANIPFLFLGVGCLALGVGCLSLGVEFLAFMAFQSALSERDLEGFLLKNLPLGAFCQHCA